MALRRSPVLALLLGGLVAGIVAGSSSGASTSQPSFPCPVAQGQTATIRCCGPPRLMPDIPCPPDRCTVQCPAPTVPNPTPPPPNATPKLSIPSGGLRVRHGRFRVTCTLAGAIGPCTVTARKQGRTIGRGAKTLVAGRARVTVRLRTAGRAMLSRARNHRMRARLKAAVGARSSTVTATLTR